MCHLAAYFNDGPIEIYFTFLFAFQTKPTKRLSTSVLNGKCRYNRRGTRRCANWQSNCERGDFVGKGKITISMNFLFFFSNFRQRELRHRTDGLSGGVSSDEDALNDGRSQAPDEDEEERQIQARLHKLVAMSRENEQDDEEPKSRRTDRRDYGDRDYEEQRERRYRQRDGSRERYSSSVSHSRRRRGSHDASPSRPKSSRWDAQRRKSPSESGNHSRSRRLVDY